MSCNRPVHRDARPPRARRGAIVSVLALTCAALLIGACGKGSSSSSTTTAAPTTMSTVKSTSTTAGSTATTVKPSPTPTGMDPWAVRPDDIEATVGSRYAFVCPAAGDPSYSVWGVGPYTDDSSICTAAVHSGVITAAKGGTVTFDVTTGMESYKGSTANGVTTSEYGGWPRQFSFVR